MARHADPAPRRRHPVLWILGGTGGVVVILLAITAVLGGFDSDGSGPPVTPIGKNIDQVRFESVVLGGSWGKQTILKKTSRFMAARVRVTNTGDRPASVNDFIASVIPLQAWGGGTLSAFDTKAYTGGTETDQLTPGVPTDVVLRYTPNAGQEHATVLNLRFCSFQHRSDFYYRGHLVWVPDCATWGTFDPREMVAPKDITAPGLSPAQIQQKARELNKQGEAARKKKVFDTHGIVAQVNIPLKGAS